LVSPVTRNTHESAPAARGGRRVRVALTFLAALLALNATVGERGLVETLRARRDGAGLSAAISALRIENARLREEVRRLKEEPSAIEALARRELGLMRRGEILFVVKSK
jgi:cell division protein FtsB